MSIPALPEGTVEGLAASKLRHTEETGHEAYSEDEVINKFGWNLSWSCLICGSTDSSKGVH
jgi:pullulanase/glycogen debranching enzyme